MYASAAAFLPSGALVLVIAKITGISGTGLVSMAVIVAMCVASLVRALAIRAKRVRQWTSSIS